MTDRMTLLALVERVVALKSPDRNVDRAIAPIIGIRVVDEGHPLGTCYYDENHHGVPLPRFTASLDAALALVPDGCNFEVTNTGYRPGATVCGQGVMGIHEGAYASTPALALCAAALRARAELE